MFAMLHGSWPSPAARDEDDERGRVTRAVRAQLDAGLELVTDGQVRWQDLSQALLGALDDGDTGPSGLLVRSWRDTAEIAAGMTHAGTQPATVAAVVTGPFTLARVRGDPSLTVTLAERVGGELAALAGAGCAMVVVDEPDAVAIGSDEAGRRQFRDGQRALLGDEPPLHRMLAITGGSASEAGHDMILEAPYHSYLFDLVAGPDNWYLVRAAPGDRGIVCAALRAPSAADQAPLLVWAARYAASANGRGLERVGLANASPLDDLDESSARASLEALAAAARLAALEPDDAVAAGLDRRTFAQPPGRGARPRRLPPA